MYVVLNLNITLSIQENQTGPWERVKERTDAQFHWKILPPPSPPFSFLPLGKIPHHTHKQPRKWAAIIVGLSEVGSVCPI